MTNSLIIDIAPVNVVTVKKEGIMTGILNKARAFTSDFKEGYNEALQSEKAQAVINKTKAIYRKALDIKANPAYYLALTHARVVSAYSSLSLFIKEHMLRFYFILSLLLLFFSINTPLFNNNATV